MADVHGHTHHQTDVVIVGAGPVGLFTVFECGMVKLACHVVDVLDDAGDPTQALTDIKELIGQDHIIALIGSWGFGTAVYVPYA